jgi:hypothetical protein
MAEENNQAIDLDAAPAGKKSGGRIFAATEEAAPQVNLDEEIEKNIRIRTMPRKFKISSKAGDKKTTIVGAVIMIVGFLVMVAAVYLAYIYLIKPQPPVSAPAVSQPQKSNQTPTVSQPVTPIPAVTPATTTVPSAATTTPIATPVATSTISTASSSTSLISSSSQPIIATSTTASFSASSTLAHDGLPLNAKVLDADNDGLSDTEEAIFGTDPGKPDTDGDGYPDGSEVLNLYDPAGPGKITANSHIAVFNDAAAKFSVDYPKIWQVQNLNNGQSIIFSAADNSFIEIVSMADTGKLSIKDWYNSQFPDTPVTDANVATKNGWQGVFHQSREIFYLADAAHNNIYTISYVPATDANPNLYHIFLMMINSLVLK